METYNEKELGRLYINFTNTAAPVRDAEIIDKILADYELVKNGTQNKQLNVSNELFFSAVQVLCNRGEIKAEKIYFMVENIEVERVITSRNLINYAMPKTDKLPHMLFKWVDELKIDLF